MSELNMRNSKFKKILVHIDGLEKGSVFAIADFSEYAQPKTVSKALERLSKHGVIEKVVRGIFWLPCGDGSSPDPEKVAEALARENNWSITPSGETAIHKMGLSKKKPKNWTYLTNGAYRSYSFANNEISMLHSDSPYYENLSKKTSLLIQVIKAYGQEKLDERIIHMIRDKYNDSEIRLAMEESKRLPKTFSCTIKSICEGI